MSEVFSLSGPELRKWREAQGLTQAKLAALLNERTGRRYRHTDISKWEKGLRPVPETVLRSFASAGDTPSSAAEGVQARDAGPGAADPVPGDGSPSPGPALEDQPPRESGPGGIVLPLPISRTNYERTCTELFQAVGGTIQVSAMFLGSVVVQLDGQIIHGDAPALGKGLAQWAEASLGVRRVIDALTVSTAWMPFMLACSQTAGKIVTNHQQYALHVASQAEAAEVDGGQAG